MKKIIAIVLALVLCSLMMVSSFATATYRGKSFYFDSELIFNFFPVEDVDGENISGGYYNEEDYGSGKPYDYYFHEFEYEGPDGEFFELEVTEYFGKFDDEFDSPEKYYDALESIAKDEAFGDGNLSITEFAGCPAVILEDSETWFSCFVCNDKNMYQINIFGDEPTEALTEAIRAAKSIKFTEKYTGKGNNAEPEQTQNTNSFNSADKDISPDVSNENLINNNNTDVATPIIDNTTLIIIVAIVAVTAIVCVVIVTTRKKK